MNISTIINDKKFNLRTAALIINNNHLLIHTLKGSPYYLLPGGRVRIGEDSETSLLRELKEELSIDGAVKSLLWVSEGFFSHNDEAYHEIGYYYLVNCPIKNTILEKATFFIEDEGNIFEFKWIPLSELKNTNFYPTFIKENIFNLPTSIKKVVDMNNVILESLSRP